MSEQEIREFIENEIIVDCYDEAEQNMSWYYYVESGLKFPFKAKIEIKKQDGSFIKKEVEVLGLATSENDFGGKHFYVEITIGDDTREVPMSRLIDVDANDETLETLAVWNFWLKDY
jgi:hypothetical protein